VPRERQLALGWRPLPLFGGRLGRCRGGCLLLTPSMMSTQTPMHNHIAAQNNLAWILATHRNAEFRDGQEALRLATRVVQQTGEGDPFLLDLLAAAPAHGFRTRSHARRPPALLCASTRRGNAIRCASCLPRFLGGVPPKLV
jgi:hypothetical protein